MSDPAQRPSAGASDAVDRAGSSDDEVVAERPREASARGAPRAALDLAGTGAIGFAMGAADVVPGFSGGTVALIGGIYERLIANVRQGARALSLLLRAKPGEGVRAIAAIEWPFVASLLAGVLLAVLTLAGLVGGLVEDEPVLMSAIFLGLVAGSTVLAARELRRPGLIHLGVTVPVAVVTFAGLGLRSGGVDDPSLLVLFAGGAVAICAMILPGVSGSFLLLLMGLYTGVIDAVDRLDVTVLAVFAAGAVVGLAGFSTLLNWLLRRFHDRVLAAMVGLLAGSSRVLWPWPSTEGVGDSALGAPVGAQVPGAALVAVLAVAAVLAFGALAQRVSTHT